MQGWSPTLFNRGDRPFSPSLVGIVWLVPLFGAWFGWELTRAGSGPLSPGRALGRTLLAYGLAARIPVALLMLVAMLGNWGTHYDARASYPQMSTFGWWVGIGLVPQFFFWIWITIVFGALFGIVAAAIARRRGTAAV